MPLTAEPADRVMPPDQDRGSAESGLSGTVTESVHAQIRADILSGALQPGAKLKLDALRNRCGASVNTLREALARLVSEGLVENVGQRGFNVVPATLADLHDITQMRLLLECHAARLALQRADLDWESRLVGAHHKLAKIEAVVDADPTRHGAQLERYNREFHGALIAACGSRWLQHFHGVMYDQSLRYRMLAFQVRDFPREQSRREHKEILEAALARDPERLTALLSAHITKGLEHYADLGAKPRKRRGAPAGKAARARG
ncbi:MAG: GntR family transcriptional regulator [Alphaproteobacteria bacterium]|nr:GntR family transcriptional regulator [Alphaproteobacteria bacterium]